MGIGGKESALEAKEEAMKDALSCNALADLCRLDRRTVGKRLANVPGKTQGRATLYALADALPVLCHVDPTSAEETQRARLIRLRADLAESELLERSCKLAPVDTVTRVFGGILIAIRQRILASHLHQDEQDGMLRELSRDVNAEFENELKRLQENKS